MPVVLFLDLDNFKDVNDALGHPAGDRLLTAVAERVQSCVRAGDMAARLGGDEFAVLLLDEPDLAAAVTVASRLIAAFAVTFPVVGQDLRVSASIGIAASLGVNDHADDLLRNADVAMYTAKQAGKNRFAVFEPTMHAAIVARHAMSTELSHAVDDGEIDVYYQPVLSLATGVIYGVEALARWRHPTRGFIEPDEFIPLAEESGTILALGRAVLFEACREAAPWRDGAGEGISLTVNLSAAQLGQETFIDDLVDILRSTGFPATRLVLEMTETVMFPDTQTTIARLHGPARPGRPDRRRRLRHRLLVAGLPAPVPGRHPQDRARVHRHVGVGPRRLGVRVGDRRARAHPRAADHRRGHRGRRPARAAPRAGLRARAGLPVREGRCRAT